VQDAVNLGWKLARVLAGTSPDELLDTYHRERHPVGARAVRTTMAAVALATPDDRHQALRETMAELVGLDETRRYLAAVLTGLEVHYDLGGDHPVVGRRMPDLDLRTSTGATRVFDLLHDARPILLHLGDGDDAARVDVAAWPRVRTVDAIGDGAWDLPVVGTVPAPAAVLVRPDGHVAWAGELADPALPRALTTWFGPA